MSKRVPNCIYCGANPGETQDHTPPRCFFGPRLPVGTQLITVPCCEPCRVVGQKDETTLRNLMISFDKTEVHPAVQSTLLGKRNRSFSYDPNEIRKLWGMTVDAEVVSPGGIFLGTDKAFNLDVPIVHAFVERMSRALIFHEFSIPHFTGIFEWKFNLPIEGGHKRWMRANLPGKELLDVFEYQITNPHESGPFWICMTFFQTLHFTARVQTTLSNERIVQI